MSHKETMKSIRYVVAKFQEETKSNSVLDFCVWLENHAEYLDRHEAEIRKLHKQ